MATTTKKFNTTLFEIPQGTTLYEVWEIGKRHYLLRYYGIDQSVAYQCYDQLVDAGKSRFMEENGRSILRYEAQQ